jgi:hypothetical protein
MPDLIALSAKKATLENSRRHQKAKHRGRGQEAVGPTCRPAGSLGPHVSLLCYVGSPPSYRIDLRRCFKSV